MDYTSSLIGRYGMMKYLKVRWILFAVSTKCLLLSSPVSNIYFLQNLQIFLGNMNFRPNQTSDLSWWPKHATFMTSNLWPGYWLHSCKEWFQFQTSQWLITEHKDDLSTAMEWKNAMKLYKPVS